MRNCEVLSAQKEWCMAATDTKGDLLRYLDHATRELL